MTQQFQFVTSCQVNKDLDQNNIQEKDIISIDYTIPFKSSQLLFCFFFSFFGGEG